MRCGRVKKIILAGYADGELSPKIMEKVKAHIRECEECEAFEKKVREIAITPFAGAERYFPPESVLGNIKSAIELEPRAGFWEAGLEWFRENLAFRRSVFAGATVAMILMAFVFRGVYDDVKDSEISSFLNEEMDFFDSLDESNESFVEDIGLPSENIFM